MLTKKCVMFQIIPKISSEISVKGITRLTLYGFQYINIAKSPTPLPLMFKNFNRASSLLLLQ
jgi:hypothetical protein